MFSGQYDLIEGKTLYDYKITSVWSVLNDHKFEWEAQGNCNRLLLHEHGVEIEKLEIIAILRDWSKTKAQFDRDYPNVQVKRIKLPVWSLEDTQKFLETRIALLQQYENTPDDELPPCTEKDKWSKPTTYAVMKQGRKRALKLFDVELEAAIYAKQNDGYVEVREGQEIRCESYCDVCTKCNYWQDKYGGK